MNAPQPSTGRSASRILAGAAWPNSAAASQGGKLKNHGVGLKARALARLDALRPIGRRNLRYPLPEKHLAAMTAHRRDQRIGQLADAAAHMSHPAARHIERGRAVERVGARRSSLGGDKQLAVHVSAQVFRLPMQMGFEWPERVQRQPRHPQRRPTRHVQTSAGQPPRLADRLRRPGRPAQRHIPERRGRLLLPTPEWLQPRDRRPARAPPASVPGLSSGSPPSHPADVRARRSLPARRARRCRASRPVGSSRRLARILRPGSPRRQTDTPGGRTFPRSHPDRRAPPERSHPTPPSPTGRLS